MLKHIPKSIIQKIGTIILPTIMMIIIVVSTPVNSNAQLLLTFIIGGSMEFIQPKANTKMELIFSYILIMVFFTFGCFLFQTKSRVFFF